MEQKTKLIKIITCLTLLLTSCAPHQFVQGDVLLPNYVHQDTLIVTVPFTIPKDTITDEDIMKYISRRTIKWYK